MKDPGKNIVSTDSDTCRSWEYLLKSTDPQRSQGGMIGESDNRRILDDFIEHIDDIKAYVFDLLKKEGSRDEKMRVLMQFCSIGAQCFVQSTEEYRNAGFRVLEDLLKHHIDTIEIPHMTSSVPTPVDAEEKKDLRFAPSDDHISKSSSSSDLQPSRVWDIDIRKRVSGPIMTLSAFVPLSSTRSRSQDFFMNVEVLHRHASVVPSTQSIVTIESPKRDFNLAELRNIYAKDLPTSQIDFDIADESRTTLMHEEPEQLLLQRRTSLPSPSRRSTERTKLFTGPTLWKEFKKWIKRKKHKRHTV